jgi:hypothetical protein
MLTSKPQNSFIAPSKKYKKRPVSNQNVLPYKSVTHKKITITTTKDKSGEKQSHGTRLINSLEESGFNVNPLEQSYPH